jgi:hypothetical protein
MSDTSWEDRMAARTAERARWAAGKAAAVEGQSL